MQFFSPAPVRRPTAPSSSSVWTFVHSKRFVAFLVICSVLLGTANKLLFRAMLWPKALGRYPFFASQLNSVILIILFGALTALQMAGQPRSAFDDSREIDKSKLSLIGFLDMAAAL